MKKIILLLAIVAVSATTKTVNSSNSVKLVVAAAKVPEAVMTTFNGHITNIADVNFPGNNGWDDSQVQWSRDKSNWACSGDVNVNGGGKIHIISGEYDNNGTVQNLYYETIQP